MVLRKKEIEQIFTEYSKTEKLAKRVAYLKVLSAIVISLGLIGFMFYTIFLLQETIATAILH